jgi:membrane protein DedA with SNARE-associated domain
MHPAPLVIAATISLPNIGEEFLLFLAVAASWAGVPAIGATALTAAAVAASQGRLDLAVVLAVSTTAGEVGGLVGYSIGDHWGRDLADRPGKHHDRRARMLVRGEQAYARWGRLAVFFTPAIISGTAKMKYGQFVLWNLLASLGFSLAVGASAYGVGRLATGHHSGRDVAVLVVGMAIGAVIVVWTVRRHRRRAAGPTPAS